MRPQAAERVTLEAAVRVDTGKQAARLLRCRGRIPAVVYKRGAATVAMEVSEKDLARVLHTKAGGNVLITLRSPKGEAVVLIKELQHHPVTHRMIHADFHQVSLTQRITVTVPLAFQGEAPGVRQEGGVLEHLRWDLEVECLPTEIPDGIEVDLSSLALGQTLHVKDLRLAPGVRAVTDPEQPVVGCVQPKAEEAAAPAPAEGAEAPEPEVIKQKKPEEAEAPAPEGGKEAKGPTPETQRHSSGV